ncbi:MAG TPA: ubiquinol-cytochrome c reductase iron-sulfur subunit [Pyrinomonadaceae bacterium]|nr:ubiquinol-cytochrome c reductase iron-sulfur subunit [Pyrinomonadaceae bacterium]
MRDEKNERRATDGAARAPEPARRRFLLLLPAAVFGSIAVGMGAAAFRFLRPRAGLVAAGAESGEGWTAVARVSELSGTEPVRHELSVALRAGWQEGRRRLTVFVLPREQNRVVSAACPHEGCEVEWRGEAGEFFCPCHDSRFGPGGQVLTGPAERDLYTLPARTTGGVLEIQYRPETAAAEQCRGRAERQA